MASNQIVQDCLIGSYLIVISIKPDTNTYFIKGFELNLKVCKIFLF